MIEQVLLKAKSDFEQLRKKAISGAIFSEKEMKDFCGSVASMSYYNNDRVENYPCCTNYKFWSLYLTYHKNLAGGIKYYKLNLVKIKKEILTLDDIASYEAKNYMYEVEPNEVERDLQYLYSVADEWEKVVRKQNHSNELLIETSKEAIKELKGFEKSNKQNPFFLKGIKYYKEKRAILLRSKYMYLKVKELLEENESKDYLLNLLGEDIYITPYTLIHVISGHFAAVTRQYFVDKTYHNEDINPERFHLLLKDIFKIFDESYITNKISPSRIMFGYNDRVYMIYTNMERRFIKGKGEISYRRLNTFYPVTVEFVKKEIDRGCTVYQLRKNIFIYCRPEI